MKSDLTNSTGLYGNAESIKTQDFQSGQKYSGNNNSNNNMNSSNKYYSENKCNYLSCRMN